MKNLIPWNWGTRRVPVTREEQHSNLYSLQREMNRLFSEFFQGADVFAPEIFEEEQLSAFNPKIDLKETDEEIVVSAELPGMTEKDLEVSLGEGALILHGEKKEEKEENVKGYYRMERKYGSFQRSVMLPCEIDKEKVEAIFKHGVLKVTLPKVKQAKNDAKKISVKTA